MYQGIKYETVVRTRRKTKAYICFFHLKYKNAIFSAYFCVMRYLFGIAFLFFGCGIFAQSSPDADQKAKALSEKSAEYHRKTDGEYDGYRIKIHFGIDKNASKDVLQKFKAKFPDILAYEDYKQPNFVVTVGNYRSRVEAFEALKKIQPEFPNAFLVKSKIKPNK